MTEHHRLERLRQRVRALEGSAREAARVLPLGVPPVDEVLPWGGLPLGCLHQVVGDPADSAEAATGPAAALGFTAAIAARLAARRGGGTVLWCLRRGSVDDTLHAPGLARLGLPPVQVMIARAADDAEVLWCMEEGLRTPALAAVVGQPGVADLTAGRRLQLAAEAGGVTGFLLAAGGRAGRNGGGAAAATTRWRVVPAPCAAVPWPGLGAAVWDVTLERCRGGLPARWKVQWDDETGDLSVAAALCDGPADTPRPPLRRMA